MTDKQCIQQIRIMMGTWEKGVLNALLKESERLISSGAIELSDEEEGSFYYPKIILHVVLETLSGRYAPISETGNEIAENLRHF